MKDIGFIIPYFGKFNNYFQLFLNSCAENTNCDWIIFTDDKTAYKYPTNVMVHYVSFDDIRKKFQEKFDFKISLEYPYKLCDFKVSYGYVFEEYLHDYKFWGHCDTDVIWGNISKFVTAEDFNNYEKIGVLGHCTLYKNCAEINRAFMQPLKGELQYKHIFSVNYNNSFDEEFNNSINNIFEEHGYKIRYEEYEANIYTKSSNFRLVRLNENKCSYDVEKNKHAFFVWNKGRLIRYFLVNDSIEEKEYFYIHMQSRPMKIQLGNLAVEKYKIIPNAFDKLEFEKITVENIKKIRIKYFNLHYFILRSRNLMDKLKKIVRGNHVK